MPIKYKDQIQIPIPPQSDKEIVRKLELDQKVDILVSEDARSTKVTNSVDEGSILTENSDTQIRTLIKAKGSLFDTPGWENSVLNVNTSVGTQVVGTAEKVYYGRPGESLYPGDQSADKMELARQGDLAPLFMTKAQYAALEDPPDSELYPALAGKTVVLTDEDTDAADFQYMAPDYASQQALNLANGQEWTAPGAGYFKYRVHMSGSGENAYTYLSINGTNALQRGFRDPSVHRYISDIVPISAGDIVRLSANSDNGTATADVFLTYFIPPEFVSLTAPKVSPDFLNVAMAPDYSNMESASRITANNGSWTADRTGYVYCSVNVSTSAVWTDVSYLVNGKTIFQSGTAITRGLYSPLNAAFPVAIGDVVQISIANAENININTISCKFIPPKFISVQAPRTENRVFPVPDYGNINLANLISIDGGSWTANKIGYVEVYGSATVTASGGSSSDINIQFLINDNSVTSRRTQLNPAVGTNIMVHDIFPVKAGDVVMFNSLGSQGAAQAAYDIQCFYVPPLYIDAGGSASASDSASNASILFNIAGEEVNVMLPDDLPTMYVASKYTDVAAGITLWVRAVGEYDIEVPEDSDNPADISALAGKAGVFTVQNMNLAAARALGVAMR